MALLRHVFEPQPAGVPSGELAGERRVAGSRRLAHAVAAVRRAPELGGLIGLAALLNLWALGQNGWANTYYSAAVRSMAASWHNFLYVSLDPSGVMTVDKPPLSLWVQALSVRVFGYHPLAILVPQALMGVASVVLVYDLVRRRFGRLGGFVAGLALATTPIAVAMSRDNNPDALLTLCCVAAVWFAVRAFEDGRTRWLVASGIAVGLGFETKMGVALVVVPAIALAWLWIAPRGRLAAIRQLLAGGGAMLAVGGAWPLLVALTPAADRPWISGTADNSILSLIFGYNGFGRVSGQTGGPGGGGGGAVFGEGTGPFRLLNAALGGQDGWLLGLALVGAVAVLVASRARRRDPRTAWVARGRRRVPGDGRPFQRRPGDLPSLLRGAARAVHRCAGRRRRGDGGQGRCACRDRRHGRARGRRGLRVRRPAQLQRPARLAAGRPADRVRRRRRSRCSSSGMPRGRTLAMGLGTAALLIAPTVWAFDTLGYAANATFPAGGPATAGIGGAGFGGRFGGGSARAGFGRPPGGGLPPALFGGRGGSPPGLRAPSGAVRQPASAGTHPPAVGAGVGGGGGFGGFGGGSLTQLDAYIKAHGGGTLAVSSQSTAASAIIASNAKVAGIGGFSGRESVPTVSWLAQEVSSGHIRWVLADSGGFGGVGGDSRPGASRALAAAAQVCKAVTVGSTTLYDCAGRAAALRALS